MSTAHFLQCKRKPEKDTASPLSPPRPKRGVAFHKRLFFSSLIFHLLSYNLLLSLLYGEIPGLAKY